jgi:hypothetical protein
MADWPYQLGAPVLDGDGNPDNYDLAGGDRPHVIGIQTAWWVMNDVGGVKTGSTTQPIGIEAQVTAFAFNTSDALNNTTFYRYKLIHKGLEPLNQTYFGIWSDPDLGNAADDYVASDTTLGLGIVYNGDAVDEGADGYGVPPALAYDFFQGPLVPDPDGGTFVDPDGTEHPGMKRLPMTKFLYYNNDQTPYGNPTFSTDDPYDYLRGYWRDGLQMTFGGNGYGGTTPTDFMFPGNPATRSYWSEENTDGRGSRNTPSDRRFLMSTGPFDLNPGDEQEIVYGIVWSQSVNQLASVAQLKFDDILAQGAFNNNFSIPPPPSRPAVSAQALDRAVILEWTNLPNSNNFLNQYDAPSAFLVDQDPPDGDVTYTFEGYRIFQYESAFDQAGTVIGTLDVRNQVTTVTDDAIDIVTGALVTGVTANGSDAGVTNFFTIENLVNFREYHFGVQAYAYNGNSAPKIYAGPIDRITVIPAPITNRNGGTVLAEGVEAGTVISSARTAGSGDSGGVLAKVVNPAGVTGATYEVSVYNTDLDGEDVLTFNLVNATTGESIINGANYVAANGAAVPLGDDLLVEDGLSFSINSAPPDWKAMITVANAAGPIDMIANFAFNANGFPFYNGTDRPSAGQQSTNSGLWGIHTGEGFGDKYEVFLARSMRNGWDNIVPHDFEIRFTEECRADWEDSVSDGDAYDEFPTSACYAYDRFSIITAEGDMPTIVPYELWDIGIDTPNDPSDDVRLIPAVIDWEGDGFSLQCWDHEVSGGANDPSMDWTYWYLPAGDDRTPGEGGYNAWVTDLLDGDPYNHGSELVARQVLVLFNGGAINDECPTYPDRFTGTSPFASEMPEVGTVFRMVTTKPLAVGDAFALNSADYAPTTGTLEGADDDEIQASLDLIGIVPNPYKGASAYEVDLTADKVRFTNLPQEATIRVFTLSGTLIKTFVKNSAATSLEWDLETEEALPIASGMYLIHVEVPDVGEKVIKFGVIKKRVQLDLF